MWRDLGVKKEGEEDENDTDVQRRGELWVLGKQKQEEGGGEEGDDCMAVMETDRNKMPVVDRRESMTWDFPQRIFFLIYLSVCLYAGRQQLRQWRTNVKGFWDNNCI